MALHKTAWQANPYLNNALSASLAVDGKKSNLPQWGSECLVSDYRETAEWRVDLNDVLSLHHIVIQYFQTKRIWGTSFHIFWKNR